MAGHPLARIAHQIEHACGDVARRAQPACRQIELFKQHFHGHIPHSLVEKALGPVLDGVKSAISAKKSEWTPTTNLTRFTRQMYAIVKFSNLLVLASRKKLDLDALPKMIRTKLYGSLKNFTGLRELYLGSD